MTTKPRRLAVLASGTGSLFEAMLAQGIDVSLFVADRTCRAMELAAGARIPYKPRMRSFKEDFDRVEYTRQMIELFLEHEITLVAMAGFMTVFSPEMFERDTYMLKILNIHPSLLPSFKGHHAVQDALDYGVRVTGTTIHWATADLDAGPILAQHPVQVLPGDTIESLHNRIKVAERELYPALLRELMN